MTVLDRLAEHLAEMKTGDISKSTVHRLMVLLRELLEARNEQNKYPLLRMFCDWSLHTKLDRSKAGNGALDILDAMWAKSKTVDAQLGELIEGVSPAKLQTEIASVLAASRIDPSLIHSPRFPIIMRHIIAEVTGKIVSRPADTRRKKTAERLAQGYRFIADRFYFEREAGEYFLCLCPRKSNRQAAAKCALEFRGRFRARTCAGRARCARWCVQIGGRCLTAPCPPGRPVTLPRMPTRLDFPRSQA